MCLRYIIWCFYIIFSTCDNLYDISSYQTTSIPYTIPSPNCLCHKNISQLSKDSDSDNLHIYLSDGSFGFCPNMNCTLHIKVEYNDTSDFVYIIPSLPYPLNEAGIELLEITNCKNDNNLLFYNDDVGLFDNFIIQEIELCVNFQTDSRFSCSTDSNCNWNIDFIYSNIYMESTVNFPFKKWHTFVGLKIAS